MLNIELYRDWESDNPNVSPDTFFMIAVGYNPRLRDHILRNIGFDLNNEISDINLFARIITEATQKNIGNNFVAQFQYNDIPWIRSDFENYKFLNSENALIKLKNYLNQISWDKEKYIGSFALKDIGSFFKLFIDYPQRYEHQPIELVSLDKDIIIIIPNHGTIWFVSDKLKLLDKIANYLKSNDATVVYSKN